MVISKSKPKPTSVLFTALATAVHKDKENDVRVLIDTGAGMSLISENIALQLRLPRRPERVTYTGASSEGVSHHYVIVNLRSKVYPAKAITIKCHIVHLNEKSLKRKGKADKFQKALVEYKQLNHAEEIPATEQTAPHYYLPVHGVFKPTSTTTKVPRSKPLPSSSGHLVKIPHPRHRVLSGHQQDVPGDQVAPRIKRSTQAFFEGRGG